MPKEMRLGDGEKVEGSSNSNSPNNNDSLEDGENKVPQDQEDENEVPKVTLLVGTKPGHLLVYSVEFNFNHINANVILERSNKSFAKKPILQLYVCVELKLILSLSDSIVSVHHLHTLQLITIIHKSKGASCFSADLDSQTSSTGESAHTLRLCIAVKKKLQLYFWNKGDFQVLRPDINMPDSPKSMAWCKDSIFLGFKRDYHIVSMKQNAIPKELFPTGRLFEPVMSKFDVNRIILAKDNISVFVDNLGNTSKQVFKWSDNPVSIESQAPYILAILPSYVEVRTIEPNNQIQNMEFPKARYISKWREWIFIGSGSNIWGIVQYPAKHQIKQLLKAKQFELALKIAETIHGNDKEMSDQVNHIKTLYAFELFGQGSKVRFPPHLSTFSGMQIENSLQALIEYLTEKRNETLTTDKTAELISIVEGDKIIKFKNRVLEIIDTTLLKCYLQTNDALIAPLLRLRENHCHPEECERVLTNAKKYPELIILYKKKDLHQKALALLTKQSKSGSQEAIIEYLQHLGSEKLDLIFEHAPAVLAADQNEGLRIFTEDIPEVDSLPKKQVLEFLERQSSDLALKYLVHLVYDVEDQTPEFHNRLILAYQRKIVDLMSAYRNELPEEGPSELVELRSKLLCFLETSTRYNASRLLKEFEHTDLAEEHAILLGRDGQHEKALGIYAYYLKQPDRAEDYCRKVYNQNSVLNKDVFLSLLKMYLHAQDDDIESSGRGKPDMDAAIRVLTENSDKIDCIEALHILPLDTDIKTIRKFLEKVIEKLKETRRKTNVRESLSLSETRLAHEKRIYHEGRRCDITEDVACTVCNKRIGNSAFAREPDGTVAHYFCSKGRKSTRAEN